MLDILISLMLATIIFLAFSLLGVAMLIYWAGGAIGCIPEDE